MSILGATPPTVQATPPSRRTVVRAVAVAVASVSVALAVGGCSDDERATAEVTTCSSKVEQAASESELRRQVELLDEAITICSGIAALDVELARHRVLVEVDTDTFV
jgi:hypothetical protein